MSIRHGLEPNFIAFNTLVYLVMIVIFVSALQDHQTGIIRNDLSLNFTS